MIKKIVWILILAGVVVYVLPKLFYQLSLFFDRTVDKGVTSEEDIGILFPPTLDGLPTATNSAYLNVRGFAQNAKEADLVINDITKDTTFVDKDDWSFSFKNVRLYEGENDISVVSHADSTTSGSSEIQKVLYKKEAPKVVVESPEDGQEFKGDPKITVKGFTDEGTTLTVNDRWVRVQKDGVFSYTMTLNEGDNTVSVIVTDIAGNSTRIDRHVRYSK